MRLSQEEVRRVVTHFMGETLPLAFTARHETDYVGVLGGGCPYHDDDVGDAVSWLLQSLGKGVEPHPVSAVEDIDKAVMAWLGAKPGDPMTPQNIRVGMVFTMGSPSRFTVSATRSMDPKLMGYDQLQITGGTEWHYVMEGSIIESLSRRGTAIGDVLTPENAEPGIEFKHRGNTYHLRGLHPDFRACRRGWYVDKNGVNSGDWWFIDRVNPVLITKMVTAKLAVAETPEPFGWVDAPPDSPKKDPRDRLKCRCHGYLHCTVRDYEESQAMVSAQDANAMYMTAGDNPKKSPVKLTPLEMVRELRKKLGNHPEFKELENALLAEKAVTIVKMTDGFADYGRTKRF